MKNARWVEEYNITTDGWVMAFPVGVFKRGERALLLSKTKLAQIAANFQAGHPAWQPPINIEHKDGRVGVIEAVEARDDGLYVKPDEAARQVLASGQYGYVSPEIQWTGYQDAKTGEYIDNVLVGLAATNYPFFGHEVALFSAKELPMGDVDGTEQADSDEFRVFSPEERKTLAEKGFALPDGSFPIETVDDLKNAIRAIGRAANPALAKRHIMKRAKALGQVALLPEDWMNVAGSVSRLIAWLKNKDDELGADVRVDHEDVTEVASLVAGSKGMEDGINLEEFKALKEKADQVDLLNARLVEAEMANKKLAEEFAAQQRLARLREFEARAEMFKALPSTGDKFAVDLMTWADRLGAEEFAKLDTLLTAADQALATGEVFSRKGSGKTDERNDAEKFVAEVVRHQTEVKSNYNDAVEAVARDKPQLYQAYVVAQREQGR